jgi:crossover junction endodeoxyribonuclease RusA
MIILPYPPSLNRLYRTVNGRMLLSSVGRDYKEECGWKAVAQKVKPLEGELEISLVFYRPQKRGDLDNSLKAFLDALNGIAYRDDAQIVKITAERREDAKNPRVEVEIMEKK